jgi:hypothetical protein
MEREREREREREQARLTPFISTFSKELSMCPTKLL